MVLVRKGAVAAERGGGAAPRHRGLLFSESIVYRTMDTKASIVNTVTQSA
eukprot:COSAG06_NODE_14678_length_1136_cov_0.851495_1_plen_49_part_10